MFTIKVNGHNRYFAKFDTEDDARKELVTTLGWTPSAIPGWYYKESLTATVIEYYEPLSLEALRTLKSCVP